MLIRLISLEQRYKEHRYNKSMTGIRSTKELKRMEMSSADRQILDDEHKRLATENAVLLDFVYLAAAPKRRDGTYNKCRESLHQHANETLNKIGL